jgi:hypothetical protein
LTVPEQQPFQLFQVQCSDGFGRTAGRFRRYRLVSSIATTAPRCLIHRSFQVGPIVPAGNIFPRTAGGGGRKIAAGPVL